MGGRARGCLLDRWIDRLVYSSCFVCVFFCFAFCFKRGERGKEDRGELKQRHGMSNRAPVAFVFVFFFVLSFSLSLSLSLSLLIVFFSISRNGAAWRDGSPWRSGSVHTFSYMYASDLCECSQDRHHVADRIGWDV